MIRMFLIASITILLGFFTRLKTVIHQQPIQTAQQLYQYKLLNAVGCSPDFGGPNDHLSIPLLKGWGHHRMKISTASDSAFLYFNQGMNMFYGFHFIEARSSFKKAQKFDSACALAYLGEALTYGPNINNPAYKLRPYTVSLVEKAKQLSSCSSEFEKALIDVQMLRYHADTSEGFQKVNETYAVAMKNVFAIFPTNSDVGALYADALLQLHPWNLYDNVGNPKPWTSNIETEFSQLMKRFPNHPGINHYYIHCVEASNTASRGLESARKLQILTPGLSHMVHMSSHIYIRTGNYSEGVIVNEKAIACYEQYKKIFPDVQKYISIYYNHNIAMGFANAMFLPNYKTAIRFAHLKRLGQISARSLNDSLSNGEQYSYCLPYLAWLRYGKWDSILVEQDIPKQLVYASFLQHFAKGMALAKKHNPSEASTELLAMKDVINHPDLQIHPQGENAPAAVGKVAISILEGVIAEEQGHHDEAIAALRKAVSEEDAMDYNEPKDWLLPARQYLGEALLSAKLFSKAEEVFREDLRLLPKNVWSLCGLFHALYAQHKKADAKNIYKQFQKALEGNDIRIEHAVF